MSDDLGDLEPRNERERQIWDDGYRHAEMDYGLLLEQKARLVSWKEVKIKKLRAELKRLIAEL